MTVRVSVEPSDVASKGTLTPESLVKVPVLKTNEAPVVAS